MEGRGAVKKKITILCIIVGLVTIAITVSVFSNQARFIEGECPYAVEDALNLLRNTLATHRTTYVDFISSTTAPPATNTYMASPHGEPTFLDHGDAAYYRLTVTESGLYQLYLEYFVATHTHSPSIFRLRINGEAQFAEMDTLAMRMRFYHLSGDFPTNAFGDQSPPTTHRHVEWHGDYFYDSTFTTAMPLLFYLQAGENIIQLTNIAQATYVASLTASPPVVLPTYQEYRAGVPNTIPTNTETIRINATNFTEKNSTDVILTTVNSPRAYPTDPTRRLINAVAMREPPGSTVTYEIYVPTSGLYAIGMNIIACRIDVESFITLRINGEIPFQEFKNFNLRGNGSLNELNFQTIYNRQTEEPFFVYLTAGQHTISVTLELEPVVPISNNVRLVTDHITQFVLDAQKITGTGAVDTNRSWNFTRYIPNTVPFLEAYNVVLRDAIYQMQFKSRTGVNAEMLAEVMVVFNTLERLLEFPDDLPLHMQSLSGSINSVQGIAGRLFANLAHTCITIDTIILSADPDELTGSDATWWNSFTHNVSGIADTFTNDRFSQRMDDDIVNIWVAQRSIIEIDLLQNMVDAHFTPYSGIQVQLSVMPDVNRLIMSAAANEVPDIAIGLPSHSAFDLASRNALHDLTQFPDFWQVAGQFPPGSMVAFAYLDGMYALPESLDFNVLAYRTDIFDSLGIPVPDTWDDVIDILPELQRFGMNFHHPLSGPQAMKMIHQTWPAFLQHGAGMFSECGTRPMLADPEAVQAFEFLSGLFVRHALPMEVPSQFDAFRRAETPIAIVSSGQYRSIRFAARELQGLWDIAPMPGIVQDDGSISRWYVANGQSAIMFNTSQNLDESWEFLTWWLSTDVQIMYSQMLASFGDLFFWVPSNMDAWHVINLPHEHLMVVQEQLMWLQDAQRIPGLYMVERAISNAWNAIVFDGMSPQRAADRASTTVNREVRRKMIEFGFFDNEGNVLREFVLRDVYWIAENIERARVE